MLYVQFCLSLLFSDFLLRLHQWNWVPDFFPPPPPLYFHFLNMFYGWNLSLDILLFFFKANGEVFPLLVLKLESITGHIFSHSSKGRKGQASAEVRELHGG